MKKGIHNLFLALGLIVLTLTSTGCFAILVGAAAGAGGYAWVKGALIMDYDVPLEKLSRAAITGLKQLDLPMVDEKIDRLSGQIVSKTADNQKVVISVKALTEKQSQVKIRVGLFGDQAKSEMILNAIKKNL